MYKWNIEITLKSGKTLSVFYKGPEINSGDVANLVLKGGNYSMNGFLDRTGTHNILVLVGEIAALDISECKE